MGSVFSGEFIEDSTNALNNDSQLLFDTFDIKKSLKIPKGGNKNQ
jgi:hypothetical protein